MSVIVCVGCGNIGSRLLQSLAASDPSAVGVLDIRALEPVEAARETAKARFDEARAGRPHQLSFAPDFKSLPSTARLTVIATDARNRFSVLSQFADVSRTDLLLLEKFLFTRFDSYEEADRLIAAQGAAAWVNTSRNVWRGYEHLKSWIAGRPVRALRVEGADWNAASNGIHFLALFEYLADERITELDASGLDRHTRESKRAGYREVTGVLRGVGDRGGVVSLSSMRDGGGPIEVHIELDDARAVVREGDGRVTLFGANSGGEAQAFTVNKASELTHAFEDMLVREVSTLPSYKESARLHVLTMRALNTAFFSDDETADECPVS